MSQALDTPIEGKSSSIVLIGGGGHALAICEAAGLSGIGIAGFLDDNPNTPISRGQSPPVRIGQLGDLAKIVDRPWIICVGQLQFRAELIEQIAQLNLAGTARSVVHPTAHVSPTAVVGQGVYIGPNAVVHARAVVHDHAIVNSGAIVEHECVIGVNSHVAPGVVLAGNVRVGPRTLIGLGARVLPNLSIGEGCLVGAGAVVTRSVVEGQRVVGVPAQPMRGERVLEN